MSGQEATNLILCVVMSKEFRAEKSTMFKSERVVSAGKTEQAPLRDRRKLHITIKLDTGDIGMAVDRHETIDRG